MITAWHYSYSTPCGGSARGMLLLMTGTDDVSINGHLFQTIESSEGWEPKKDAADLTAEIGWPEFDSAEEVEEFLREREGWTLDAPLVIEEVVT